MIEKEVSQYQINIVVDNGGQKKCVAVENATTVILEAKPDYKVFNFDFVGDEDLD